MGGGAGLVAPDATTLAYLKHRPAAPRGDAWDAALARWAELASDPGAAFDRERQFDAREVRPMVSWGTNPSQVVAIAGHIPDPALRDDHDAPPADTRALAPTIAQAWRLGPRG